MAVRVEKWSQKSATVQQATVTRVHAGSDVGTVWVISADDIYVSYDSSKTEADAIDASNRELVPAGMRFPLQIGRGAQRPVVAKVAAGSTTVHFSGEP